MDKLEPPRGTSWSEDAIVVLSTVCALEALRFLFGWQVAAAVAITALIGCVAFLYHAGRSRTPAKHEAQ